MITSAYVKGGCIHEPESLHPHVDGPADGIASCHILGFPTLLSAATQPRLRILACPINVHPYVHVSGLQSHAVLLAESDLNLSEAAVGAGSKPHTLLPSLLFPFFMVLSPFNLRNSRHTPTHHPALPPFPPCPQVVAALSAWQRWPESLVGFPFGARGFTRASNRAPGIAPGVSLLEDDPMQGGSPQARRPVLHCPCMLDALPAHAARFDALLMLLDARMH